MEGSNYWFQDSAFLSEVAVNHLKKARGEIWPKRSERRNHKKKTTSMRTKSPQYIKINSQMKQYLQNIKRNNNTTKIFNSNRRNLWGMWLKVKGEEQGCVAVWYLTPFFDYFILPPRWLVGVTPCPRKSKKNYTKEKTETDKRRRRFFYTCP